MTFASLLFSCLTLPFCCLTELALSGKMFTFSFVPVQLC